MERPGTDHSYQDQQSFDTIAGQHTIPEQPEQITLDVSPGPQRHLEEEEHSGGGAYGIGSFTALLTVGKDVAYGLDDVGLINRSLLQAVARLAFITVFELSRRQGRP